MKKILPFFTIIAALLCAISCNRPSATINGCIDGGANAKVTLMYQGATTKRLLDTLHADANGCFRYKIKQSGSTFDPMFVSLSVDEKPLALLLVENNEKIKLAATKGTYKYTVDGSEGSKLVQQLNNDLYESSHRFDSLMKLAKAEQERSGSTKIPEQLNLELGDIYVKQYRSAVRFIAQHPHSLACVAALNQQLPNDLSLFPNNNDAIRFKMVYDSLVTYYPHSEYVLALRDEYEVRFNRLLLLDKITTAPESGFVDLELSNATAEKIALSSLKGNVILLYFWVSTSQEQLMYNNELKGLYNKYHAKGFTIYQVALDTDKTVWAKTIAGQQLPWINVCDGLGAASSVIQSYNIKTLPAAFLINKQGDIVAANIAPTEVSKKIGELCR